MNFQEYQDGCFRTANRGLSEKDQLANWGLGLAGEAGEVIEHIKKHLFHGKDLDKEKMKDEMSDVFWYLASLANTLGLKLEDIATHNIEKLQKRYPEKFTLNGGIR
jgi:NTP pyrophosphatase (non-canonical NTP hydrolase)